MESTKSRESEVIGSTRSLTLIVIGVLLAAIWPAVLTYVLSMSWNLGTGTWGFEGYVLPFIAVSAVSGLAGAGLMVKSGESPLGTLLSSFVLGSLIWPLALFMSMLMFLLLLELPEGLIILFFVGLPLGTGIMAAIALHRCWHSTRETVTIGLTGFAVGAVALVPLGSALLAGVDEVDWAVVVKGVVFAFTHLVVLVSALAGPISVVWWKLMHPGTRTPAAPMRRLRLSAVVVAVVTAVAIVMAVWITSTSQPEWCDDWSHNHPACAQSRV